MSETNDGIWYPFSPLKGLAKPKLVKEAKDCTLTLEDGTQLIDAISSWWVNPMGHANKTIAEAVYQQMLTLEHVIFAGYTHQPALDLTKKLLELGKGRFDRVFFSDNGSTSVEVALKIAIQFFHNSNRPRKKIVSFTDAYHGDTFGAMAVGQKGTFFKPFEDHVFEVIQIPIPSKENLSEVLRLFEKTLSDKDVAAFIFEPLLLGAGGMKTYKAEHLNKLISIAHNYGTLCIADEVMTGFGRTGKMFASDYLTEKPDLMCLSKCLTGGFMPMSVTLISPNVTQAFDFEEVNKAFYHGHSYTGNPLGCAAANASLNLIDSAETSAHWKRINSTYESWVEKLKSYPIENLRIQGTVLAFEVKAAQSGYFSNIKKQLTESFISEGVLLRPLGNTVYVMPPYVITDEELATVFRAICKGLESL